MIVKPHYIQSWLITVALMLVIACTSRYRLDMFLVSGETKKKIKVEKTEFIMNGVLNDPVAIDKVVRGPGNCIVLITGSRGEAVQIDLSNLVGYDRYLRYKIFLQLPSKPERGLIRLENNSFVQLLGYYELLPEDKMYLAREGTLVVDSIPGKHLFGTINGNYENNKKQQVSFQGQFKVRIAN